MLFKDLYLYSESVHAGKSVLFQNLKNFVIENIDWLEDVNVYKLHLQDPIKSARYSVFDDRSSAYSDEFLVADISYCHTLEQEPLQLKYALVKELMHVYDDRDGWVDSAEKFYDFLQDLQNTPLDDDKRSLFAERAAKWMAILILCPKSVRDAMKADLDSGQRLVSEVAAAHNLPDWLIDNAVSSYYDDMYTRFVTHS